AGEKGGIDIRHIIGIAVNEMAVEASKHVLASACPLEGVQESQERARTPGMPQKRKGAFEIGGRCQGRRDGAHLIIHGSCGSDRRAAAMPRAMRYVSRLWTWPLQPKSGGSGVRCADRS